MNHELRDKKEREDLKSAIERSNKRHRPTIEAGQPNGNSSKYRVGPRRKKVSSVSSVEEADDISPPTPLATSRPQSPFTQHPTIDFDGLSWPCE
jgi:GTP cyclohydrolase IA